MFTEHAITLNIVPGDVPPVAHVSQYDIGREIRITLLDGSKGFELSPDYSYTLVGTKSSGRGFSYDDILEIVNNALVFKTNGQMTVAEGPVVCGIIIMDGNEHVETLSFILEVHQSALTTDTIVDSDDFHSIIQDEVRAYLERTGILIDRYLRVQGAAADAKATGDALALKVNKPVSSPNGESGQFLRTNGDGTTTWANAAVPTDSQLGEAVQDWLDNHPDATLNIEDGSIMPVKLSDGINALLDEVNNLDENYAAVDFENVDTAWVSTGFARRLLTDQGLISDEDTARGTVRNGYLTGINVVGESITAGTIDGNNVQMVNIPASQLVGNITRSQIANGSIDLSALTSGVTDEIDSALAIAGLARQEIAATNENISNFESSVTSSISDLQDQIDGAIETWFYDGAPSSSTEPEVNWTTTDEKNNHLGDLYYDGETGYCYRYQLNDGSYEWHLIADSDISTALAAAAAAQDTADSKRRVFYEEPRPPYDQGDLWVQGSGGDILRCQTAKVAGGVYARSDWVLASKYTDDTVASQAFSIANGKSTAYYQATEPEGGTYTANDIWFDTGNDNKMYSWDGIRWVPRLLDTNALDDGAITAEKIFAGAVTTGKIDAGAVTTNELAANAVTSEKILAGEVKANNIATDAILARHIASDQITARHIVAGSITANEIDSNVLKVSSMSDANTVVTGTTVKTQYYLSTSSQSATGGTNWQDTIPAWSSGKYIWTRTATTKTFADGTSNTTYSPENGVYDSNLTTALSTANSASTAAQNAQNTANSAAGSVSVKTQYYLSTSSTALSGGSWSNNVPTWSSGKYIWVRTATTVTPVSGTATTSYTPSTNGAYDSNLTTALMNAATAQSTANGANYREQTIYISKASGTTSVSANTTWVTVATDSQNTWTTKRPTYNSGYPVLFVATQRQTVAQSSGTTCSCTTPVKDDTTTIIDGGHITTGTIDANNVTISNLTVAALTNDAQQQVLNSVAVSTANSYTDSAVSSIEVGGRNLFIAATRTNNKYVSDSGILGNWNRTVLSDYIAVSPGDSMIAQFWKPENTSATGDDRGYYNVSYWNSSKAFISRPYQYFTGDYISYSFIVPSDAAYIRVTYHFGIDGPPGADWDPYGSFQVKVEKGNMPTDWSIAPEDIDSELTTVQSSITQTANEIRTEVSQNSAVVNMLPSIYYREYVAGTTYTSNGITWTVNNDGSVTANGTATADSNYSLNEYKSNYVVPVMQLEVGQKYTVSGCPSGGSSSKYYIRVAQRADATSGSSPSSNANYYDYGSSVTFASTTGWANFYLYVKSGQTVSNLTFYPMLERGETVHGYVSTHNGSGALKSSITQNANNIASKVSQEDYNGNEIASLINQTATTVQIDAAKINLNGYVTFTNMNGAIDEAIVGNLIINTETPDVSSPSKYPKIFQASANTATSAGTVATAEHGIKITNTSAVRPYVRFGTSSTASATMQGLKAGETYTLSYDCSWKLLSGTISNTTTYYLRSYLYTDTATTGTLASTSFYTIGTITNAKRGTEMTGRCEFTFTVPSNTTMLYLYNICNYSTAAGYAAGDYIEMRNIKLEYGSSATAWTPTAGKTIIDGSNIITDTLDVHDINMYGDMTVNQSKGGAVGGTLGYMSGMTTDDQGQNPSTTHGMGLKSSDGDHYLIVTTDGIRLTEKVSDTKTNDVYLANGNFVVKADSVFRGNLDCTNASKQRRVWLGTGTWEDNTETGMIEIYDNNTTRRALLYATTGTGGTLTLYNNNNDPDTGAPNESKQINYYSVPRTIYERDLSIDPSTNKPYEQAAGTLTLLESIAPYNFFTIEIAWSTGYINYRVGTQVYVPDNGTIVAKPSITWYGNARTDICAVNREVTINKSNNTIALSTGERVGYSGTTGAIYAIVTRIIAQKI